MNHDLESFTCALAAADHAWSVEFGDAPAAPNYIRHVASRVWGLWVQPLIKCSTLITELGTATELTQALVAEIRRLQVEVAEWRSTAEVLAAPETAEALSRDAGDYGLVPQPQVCGHRLQDTEGAGWTCDLPPGHPLIMHSFEDRIFWSAKAFVVDGAL